MKEDKQEKLAEFEEPKLSLQFPLKQDIHQLENEKQKFIEVGINLIDSLSLNEEQFIGRPRASYNDILKSLLMMAFHGLSYRRAKTDILNLYSANLIDSIPKRSTLSKYMNEEKTKKLLEKLIQQTALFFRDDEDTLIVDSTWLSTRMYTGGYVKVHDKTSHNYVNTRKLHIGVLKNSKIIAIAKTSTGTVHDNKLFKPLVTGAVKNGFDIKTLLADKGYSSKDNYFLCTSLNIKNIFIDFKKSAGIKRAKSNAWREQLSLLRDYPEIWKETYRYRVIVEGVISTIKRKFLNHIRSRKDVGQECELLLKCLMYNLTIIGKYS